MPSYPAIVLEAVDRRMMTTTLVATSGRGDDMMLLDGVM